MSCLFPSQRILCMIFMKVTIKHMATCNLKPIYDDYDLVFAGNLIDRLYSPRKFLTMIHERIRPGGLLISDKKFVKTPRRVDARQIELPIYQTVMEEIGRPVVFNICVLGALIGMCGIVRKGSVEKVLADKFPPSFMQGNQMALDIGFEMGFEYAQ